MSGIENKWEAIDFFPICTTKTNELGLRRGLVRVAEQRKENDDTRDTSLYAFHSSH